MVPTTAAVVAHGAADGLGQGGDVADEFFEGELLKGLVAGDGFVEVVDVGLVVTSVMDLHRGRVDERFEGFLRVGEGCEFVCHGVSALS